MSEVRTSTDILAEQILQERNHEAYKELVHSVNETNARRKANHEAPFINALNKAGIPTDEKTEDEKTADAYRELLGNVKATMKARAEAEKNQETHTA